MVKKVIRLVPTLHFGGIETRTYNVAIFLSSSTNIESLMVSCGRGGDISNKLESLGIIPITLNQSLRIPNFKLIYQLSRIFLKHKPDVIHTSGAEANFHGIIAGVIARIPKIIGEEVGIPSQSKKANFVFSILFRFCAKVIGNSEPVIDYLNSKNNVPKNKLLKIYNPILQMELPPKEKDCKGKFIITLVSRLEPVKNIEGFLLSYSLLPQLLREKTEIWIIGDGSLKQKLIDNAYELNLSDNIKFLGFKKDPQSFLMKSDLFVLNSFSEGFSNTLVEAMYCGVPVLSTNVGAAGYLIEDGKTGFLISPNDVTELKIKLQNILEMDYTELKCIGSNGAVFVKKNLSIERHVAELEKVYHE